MNVADIQRFCMHDGPGLRTTIFLKGCPLNCAWCHNPETQSTKSELLYYKTKCIGCKMCSECKNGVHNFEIRRDLCIGCGECVKRCPTNALELIGKEYNAYQLYEIIAKDAAFYGEDGGVTLSGGEPFMQCEEVFSLLELCKKNGINTAIETCGYFKSDLLHRAVPLTDLFLWDIKDTNSSRHKKYTGVSNEQIISNLILADSLGAKTQIRCILVNGVNTMQEHYENVLKIYNSLKNCVGVEVLPCHSYGIAKYEALGKNTLCNDNWIPDSDQIIAARKHFKKLD